MGKLVARINNKDLPKNLREKYSAVEHFKEAGRIAIYGIEKDTRKKRRIATKKLIESYGRDPAKKAEPAKAVWNNDGRDKNVMVTGSYGLADGEEFMRISGSKTGIPRSELKWVNNRGANPEKDDFQAQITELRAENAGLSSRLEALEGRFDEVLARNQELETRNQELESRNQELEAQLDAYRNGDAKIVTSPVPHESDNNFISGFNRATGWIGRKLPRSRPPYESGVLVEHNGAPAVVVEEEWRDGYSQYERRRGAAAVIGAAALVGVAVLAAGLWGEHEEQEGRGPQVHQTIIHKSENPALRAKLKEKEALNSNLKHLLHQKNVRIRTLEKEEKHEERAGGETFYVEPGNGITNEIQEYAKARGYQGVSGSQAWILYENMRDQFGTNLVELPGGGNDTYIRQQGDIGISRPGPAKWPEQVEHFLQSRLSR